MRLNKYIAHSGLVSRRKADELIVAGKVKVNGKLMKELGYDVADSDEVEVAGSRIKPATKKVYVAVNKPKGYVTTAKDDKERLTVMDLIGDIDERLFPVGRLDYNTSGLLIMTNDGDTAYRIAHPKHEVWKTYKARINGYISMANLEKLRKGIKIDNYTTAPAEVTLEKPGERSCIIEIKIHEGRNRQVRKMFAAVGHRVLELERIQIGQVNLGHLKEGHYRKLTDREIEYLKML